VAIPLQTYDSFRCLSPKSFGISQFDITSLAETANGFLPNDSEHTYWRKIGHVCTAHFKTLSGILCNSRTAGDPRSVIFLRAGSTEK
jgi:hypothetical protein